MTLEELTLERIPTLTDEECDALHAELSGFTMTDEARIRMTVPIRFPRICHPDCPASVLEGLPALVERRTGRRFTIEMGIGADGAWAMLRDPNEGDWWDPYYHAVKGWERFDDWQPRHLPHACLCAAFAAIVVLGSRVRAGKE